MPQAEPAILHSSAAGRHCVLQLWTFILVFCRRISSLVSSMILLRDVLVLLPALAKALEPAESQLLVAIRQTAGHPVFAEMQQHVEAVIDEVRSAPSSSAAALLCKPWTLL